jgi:hypothetical protein
MRALLVIFLAASAHAQPSPSPSPAPESSRLDGRVLERGNDRPLSGIVVRIVDLNLSATTDATGYFLFEALPAGTHRLEIGGTPVDEELAPGTARTVTYRLAPTLPFEATVRAPLRREAVETRISVEEGRRAAGTQGDALKIVQDLPGVARAPFGQGQLVVWGAAPADTRIYVDDVEVPLLYHLGGFRSTVNDGLVRDLAFSPGGQGAAWGRGLGGLVRVTTRPLSSEGVHGFVGADVMDASALIEAALGKRVSLVVAGRYSYLDQIAQHLVSARAGDYVPIPRWDDYQMKLTVRLRADESLALSFLGSDDRLTRTLPSSDPAAVRSDRQAQSFYRAALRYLRHATGSSVEATAFFGFDHSLLSQSYGTTSTRLGDDAWRYGARAVGRRRIWRRLWLAVGADVQGTYSSIDRLGSLTLPPREGDIFVAGQPPPGDLSAERFTIHQLDAAPFVEAEILAGPVTLTPGLRVDALLTDGNHATAPGATTPAPGFSRIDWSIDPRLTIAWRAHRRVTVALAGGLYHQPPDPADLSAVFGNPRLAPARAWQLTTSLGVAITSALSVEAAGFVKWLQDLPARNPLPSPPLGQALTQDGTGFVYGGQLLVRAQPWRGLSGFLSYTVGRSERRDHPSSPTRLFDFDQTHVLALVANWAWRGLGLGARLRWSSGYPRTPVVGAYFDARDDLYQPLFGAQNSTRLPDFVQLDLRVDYTFRFRRAQLALYLDVENLTDRKNAEEVVYREDFSQKSYVTGLPTTAVLGARVSF